MVAFVTITHVSKSRRWSDEWNARKGRATRRERARASRTWENECSGYKLNCYSGASMRLRLRSLCVVVIAVAVVVFFSSHECALAQHKGSSESWDFNRGDRSLTHTQKKHRICFFLFISFSPLFHGTISYSYALNVTEELCALWNWPKCNYKIYHSAFSLALSLSVVGHCICVSSHNVSVIFFLLHSSAVADDDAAVLLCD